MGKTFEERVEIGDEAARLLKDKLFNTVISSIVADGITQLLNTVPGSDEAVKIHGTLVGLEQIKQRLKVLENDAAMARKEAQRRSGTT